MRMVRRSDCARGLRVADSLLGDVGTGPRYARRGLLGCDGLYCSISLQSRKFISAPTKPASGSYPEPGSSYLIFNIHLRLRLPSGLFPSDFRDNYVRIYFHAECYKPIRFGVQNKHEFILKHIVAY